MIPSIQQSKNDNRTYKYIKLPNKLNCLLVSDPDADKSAASLDVKVGSALDPKPLYGIAHFLEHMLFLGTRKYPMESEYKKFIEDNGGYSNAHTFPANTNYHFEVSNEAFKEALDRFSQFFIAPNFNESATEREMKAVDSEFKQDLQDDYRHFLNMIKREAHPQSKFNSFQCGNLETLQQEGIREALLDFHSKWYSANMMKLVISSKHEIIKLEEWVNEYFTQIENKNVTLPNMNEIEAYNRQNLGYLYKWVPIQDEDLIQFYWYLPECTQGEYQSNPLYYLASIFNHQGQNSLISYLVAEGLALSLSANRSTYLWSFDVFNIDIHLTQKGLKEYSRVIEAVFQYAKMVQQKGITEQFFKEIQAIDKINFQFQEKFKAISYIQNLAYTMQYMEKDEEIPALITCQYFTEQFDRRRIQYFADQLAEPFLLNIYIESKSFTDEVTQEVPYFKTRFSKELFSENILYKMRTPNLLLDKKKFDLPLENKLIPQKFEILGTDPTISQKPKLIKQWDNIELWLQKDDKFKVPKASINFKIYTNDLGYGTIPQARVDNIHFYFSGYNDSLGDYVLQTIEKIKNIHMKDHEDLFDEAKECLLQEYTNYYLASAQNLALNLLEKVLINEICDKKTLKNILEKLTFENFEKLHRDWLQKGRMIVFMSGNINQQQSIDIVEKLRDILQMKSIDKDELSDVRAIELERGNNYLQEYDEDRKTNENSCLVSFFQYGLEGDDLKLKMIQQVMMSYLHEPTYTQLRTQEQLGYSVYCRNIIYREAFGSEFVIQSSKYCCEYMVNSLNQFLQRMRDQIKDLSNEEFFKAIQSVKTSLQEKDQNLSSESWRMMNEISVHKYVFGRQEKEIEILSQLTKQNLIDHFEYTFFSENTRRLDFEVNAYNHMDEQKQWKQKNNEKYYSQKKRVEIKDSISIFKKKMKFYPDPIKVRYLNSHLLQH